MSTQDIKILAQRYGGNVAKLLTLGRAALNPQGAFSYRNDVGIEERDTEQLLQLATDNDIYHYVYGKVSDEEAKEFFGVIHAWKALSELAVPEAKILFQKLMMEVKEDLFDDWILVEFRGLMVPYRSGMFAESVEIIENESINEWIRLEYLELVRDMLAHGEVTVAKVNKLLAKIFATSQSRVINAFAIGICTDHQLVEHYDAIATCYENDLVDIEHLGDLEDVEIKFGMRSKRSTKRQRSEDMMMLQEIADNIHLLNDTPKEQEESAPLPSESKIGRNNPCPCGSGKKYKKCCMHK
jgi:hypothetical protein